MPPTNLTEAFIRRLVYDSKPVFIRDTEVRGLMVAVHKKTKSYKVQRDLWVGKRGRRRKVKTVRHTLGTTQQLTLYDARTRAMQLLIEIKNGVDPNAPAAATGAEVWTVEQMFNEYADDLLFQVYDKAMTPQVLEDAFMFNENVVNFEKYAAFIWAELLVFFDELGMLIVNYLSIDNKRSATRAINAPYMATELDNIIEYSAN